MSAQLLWQATLETLYMTGVATLLAHLAGIPMGVLLVVTDRGHVLEHRWLHEVLAAVVNIGRSVPFIILLVAIIPFTRWVVGTSIGTSAAMVPLTVAAIPFVARLVETALREVDPGVVEAALSMGATPWQIVTRVLLPEALPSLALGAAITAVSVLGYSAMAGAVGGGGLGDLAVRYGYQRFRTDVMLQTVVLLVILVQAIQAAGDAAARRLRH
ncbi:methionine ABC transporter permease [Geochorda subterranea]|uniref:Methionine ABC transporter permease n=1 Tax=Geochorda subterranea TaxID=3109564 RepID=A0ABZ1BR75_9FIRM|nr:methionine ABC transporter permease [Limnochorda sp. LNt]WRP15194.1 methionine ABC transporter permease [Limnochorda sp. LNt]